MNPRRFFRCGPAAALAMLLTLPWSPAAAGDAIRLTGAGATFPAPLYQRWFRDYFLAHPEVRVDYQAIGSGGGLENLVGGRLDFAGSDLPLAEEGAAKVEGGVIQLPLSAGAVVMTYHLPGIEGLRLSREAVAAIFLGRVERWNDPLIAGANEGLALPDLPVTVAARADASGTTFVTTRHLSAISPEFATAVGASMNPVWPEALKDRGALIRGKGNGGVAAYVKAVPGAIGYVQYSYAHLTGMQMASLQNQAGEYVAPHSDSFRAALASFRDEIDPTLVSDPSGAASYPIVTLSWLIAKREYDDHRKAEALKDVIRYSLSEGQKAAEELGYIPLAEQSVRLLLQKVGLIEPRP